MSYEIGWAAINLDMPPRVPRTEYSAEGHWDLIRAVTGIDVNADSPAEARGDASLAFRRAWNYDFCWNILIYNEIFGNLRTDMGHAEYAAGGVDRRDTIRCPFNDPQEVLDFDPWKAYGQRDRATLIRNFEKHYQETRRWTPDEVTMTGIYVTLISGLIEIFGWDMLLMAAGIDPVAFGEMTNRYSSWIQQYFDALAAADVPVVMVHDDMVWTSGAIFKPDWYRKYVFPNLKRQLAPLRDSGKKIMFTCDGTYTEFIDDIAGCGIHGFVLEPTTDMAYIAENYGQTHAFIGNADTRILLSGTKSQIRTEVERCMSIGKHCPGFFMAVGNHIPANTPVENAIYYNQCYLDLCRR